MTVLSVNVNKIALLRNSRGRNFPDLLVFVRRLIGMGVRGITVHPRQDERHVTRQDVVEITALLKAFPGVEFNIEGYPSPEFMALIARVKPACSSNGDRAGMRWRPSAGSATGHPLDLHCGIVEHVHPVFAVIHRHRPAGRTPAQAAPTGCSKDLRADRLGSALADKPARPVGVAGAAGFACRRHWRGRGGAAAQQGGGEE